MAVGKRMGADGDVGGSVTGPGRFRLYPGLNAVLDGSRGHHEARRRRVLRDAGQDLGPRRAGDAAERHAVRPGAARYRRLDAHPSSALRSPAWHHAASGERRRRRESDDRTHARPDLGRAVAALDVPRPPERRFIGIFRDYALLAWWRTSLFRTPADRLFAADRDRWQTDASGAATKTNAERPWLRR